MTSSEQSHSRPPSPHGIGALTRRSGSVPGTARRNEGDMVHLFRRQLEATEEKFNVQIGKVQQQNDKLRDAAFSRVDSKLCGFEALQPKLDRRLAELAGNCQGLSAEMQVQIRRVDQIDSRLRAWKQELEDMIDNKFADAERSCQQIESSARLSSSCAEDSINRWSRRLLRLEGLVDERTVAADDVNQSLLNLHARLSQMEDAQEELPMRSLAPQAPLESEESDLALLESRLADAHSKLLQWQVEFQDFHVRIEAQEERLKSLRTLMETKDESVRSLSDRIESADWDGHFKELQEQIGTLGQRVELGIAMKDRADPQEDQVALCHRVEELERRAFEPNQALTVLLEQLREVAPKVIKHEGLLRDLQANQKRQSGDHKQSDGNLDEIF